MTFICRIYKGRGVPPFFTKTIELKQRIFTTRETIPTVTLARVSATFVLRLRRIVRTICECIENIVI